MIVFTSEPMVYLVFLKFDFILSFEVSMIVFKIAEHTLAKYLIPPYFITPVLCTSGHS